MVSAHHTVAFLVLAATFGAAAAGAEYREIDSIHGHDAFLLEPGQVGQILREALEQAVGETEPVAIAGEVA